MLNKDSFVKLVTAEQVGRVGDWEERALRLMRF